jgi:hypothetical protein
MDGGRKIDLPYAILVLVPSGQVCEALTICAVVLHFQIVVPVSAGDVGSLGGDLST